MSATTLSGARAPLYVGAQVAQQPLRTAWLRLFVVPIAIGLTQAPWWWEVVTPWGQRGPLAVVAAVPVLALLAGWRTLRSEPLGRQIHDRQLDMILCVLITVMAAGLLLLAPGGRSLEAAGASCLTAAAIVVAAWGSRTLWQLRWPILLLLLTWVEPWAQLDHRLSAPVARLAVEAGRIASPALVAETTTAGGWRLTSPSSSGWVLDPTAGGGVLLMVFVGLLCGIAWACCCRGRLGPLGAVGLGTASGLVVAGTEWLVCILWAARGSQAAVDAWASGLVHLWALLIVVLLIGIAAIPRFLLGRSRRRRSRSAQKPTTRVAGRLTKAVPQAGRATYAVCAVSAVLTVLTARATSSSTFEIVSRTIAAAVDVVWP
jgi:hypothetical protein